MEKADPWPRENPLETVKTHRRGLLCTTLCHQESAIHPILGLHDTSQRSADKWLSGQGKRGRV